jgi:hypothetical protein
MADINIEWMWIGVGFVAGVCSCWIVSDLVFPIRK